MKKSILRKMLLVVSMMLAVSMMLTACVQTGGSSGDNDGTTAAPTTAAPTTAKADPTPVPIDMKGREFRIVAKWNEAPSLGVSAYSDLRYNQDRMIEEKFNCKVTYVRVPNAEYLNTFITSMLANDPKGELWFMDSPQAMPLASKSYLLPLSDYIDMEQEKWDPNIVKLSSYNNKVYGVSDTRGNPEGCFFFNKKMLEDEGLPNIYDLQDADEWTWEKMREIAIATTKDFDGDGVYDQFGLSNVNYLHMINANGASILTYNPDGMDIIGFNNQNTYDTIDFMRDLIHVDKVVLPYPEGSKWDYPMQQFMDGKTAMYFGQYSQRTEIIKKLGTDFGGVLVPKGPNGENISYTIKQPMRVIPASVKDPENICAVTDALLTKLSDEILESLMAADCPDQRFLDNIFVSMKNLAYNPTTAYSNVPTQVEKAVNEAIAGTKSTRAAMEEIVPSVNEIIRSVYEQ